ERLLEVLDQDVAVAPQVAFVPGADEVREEVVEVVHVRPVKGLLVQRVNRPDPFPAAVLVVVFPLAVLEGHPELDLPVRLHVVHLERIPHAALVHRSVEQLDCLDRGGIEAGSPMPISVRERDEAVRIYARQAMERWRRRAADTFLTGRNPNPSLSHKTGRKIYGSSGQLTPRDPRRPCPRLLLQTLSSRDALRTERVSQSRDSPRSL